MKIEIRIEASINERRRLFGSADLTPIVELISDTQDHAMTAVVEARLAVLESDIADDVRDDEGPAPARRQASR